MSTLFRALGMLGRVLMTAGTVLLLFAAYQLWGTGLHTAAAQDDLESEVVASFEAAAATPGTLPAEDPTATTPGGGTAGGPPPTPDEPVTFGDGKGIGEVFGLTEAQIEALPPPEVGDPVGYISIPEIGSNWWYVEGADLAYLRDGPGHFQGTSWPGQSGNAALAGHRTTYGAPFHRIDELEPGDEVLIENAQGEFRYEVMARSELWDDMPIDDRSEPDSGHFIVTPNDTWILDDYGDDRITLMACHPKYSAAQRIVVVARLTDVPAPTTEAGEVPEDGSPESVMEESLITGDSSARLPAVLWAVAAGAVWLLAWQVGRTWRRAKWPAYAVGLPVFLVVLFVCFTYVEQLLPAGY